MREEKTGKKTIKFDIFHQDELFALKIALDYEYFRIHKNKKHKNLAVSLHSMIDRFEQMERDGEFKDIFTKEEYWKMRTFGTTSVELPLTQRQVQIKEDD